MRDFQIKKCPIAFRAGEQGAGGRGRKNRFDSKNWIIYFLEFPDSKKMPLSLLMKSPESFAFV
ncbi:hypothetical protein COO91_02760 [Nostoc flagelliforme CCNUN1]|uniref:Uncharacterized protein n=1 Tax=Nostoc flagelliforme CCNUN1 TaxID=2038116 RepID=A0A2K8SPU8_9NOSO|nr:hypothetical protein COO91_02760 [Nostoc flagelliforme CCNUN1]